MKTITILASIVLLAAYGCQNNASNTGAQASNGTNMANMDSAGMAGKDKGMALSDSDFLVKAYDAGNFEIAAGKMARAKSNNESIKKFAARMITDHGELNNSISKLASGKNIFLPMALSGDLKSEKEKLDSLKGTAFDAEYATANLKGHQEVVKMFEEKSTGTGDKDIKNFAISSLPKLREHLQMAQSLDERLTASNK